MLALLSRAGYYNHLHNGSVARKCAGTICEWGTDVTKLNKKDCCSFSEQEVADCTRGGLDNCNKGGEPHDGVMWMVNKNNASLNTEAQYPYVSGDEGHITLCRPQPLPVSTGVYGYGNVSQNEVALTKALYANPVRHFTLCHRAFLPTFPFR